MGQTSASEAAAEARLRAGPIALNPRFALRDVGIDTNVLNEEDQPQRDFTMTAGPGLEAILRVGRVWVTSTSGVEWVYYRTLESQRSFNVEQRVRVDLDLLHLVPHVEAGYERARQRINFELDGRLEERRTDVGAGLEIRPGARTVIDLRGSRTRVDFADELFAGTPLANVLNREESRAGIDVEYALTPLTTLTFESALVQERFEASSFRDSDSLRLVPGLQFDPFALISGEVHVGMQRFETREESIPDYTGLVASVDVSYTLRDNIRFTVRTERDVQYSIEELEPFYVRTGAGLEVTKVIGLNWDVVATAHRTGLAYQAVEGAVVLDRDARVDRIDEYRLGLGRHLGENIRVGVDVMHIERRSDRPGRSYAGWRTGGSVTYGF